jgi:predicted TIM-barrel fold metal-dependent hydrolase
MIIDAHTHFYQDGFLSDAFHKHSAKAWAAAKEGRKPEMIMEKLSQGILDPDGRMFINNLDHAGVDLALIHILDAGEHWSGQEPEIPLAEQYALYSELQQTYPDRLRIMAYADPRRSDCIDLMTKAVDEYGFVGCGELVPEGFNIKDDFVQPLFRFCQERNLPVAIHTRIGTGVDVSGADKTKANSCHPQHISEVMDRYPDLVVLISHVGWPIWWESACQVARDKPNCYLELSNWTFGLADSGEMIPKLACMRDMVGADHMIFGSDQPSGKTLCVEQPFLKGWVDFFKNLPQLAAQYGYDFSDEEIKLILGKNAARIFGI